MLELGRWRSQRAAMQVADWVSGLDRRLYATWPGRGWSRTGKLNVSCMTNALGPLVQQGDSLAVKAAGVRPAFLSHALNQACLANRAAPSNPCMSPLGLAAPGTGPHPSVRLALTLYMHTCIALAHMETQDLRHRHPQRSCWRLGTGCAHPVCLHLPLARHLRTVSYGSVSALT